VADEPREGPAVPARGGGVGTAAKHSPGDCCWARPTQDAEFSLAVPLRGNGRGATTLHQRSTLRVITMAWAAITLAEDVHERLLV
jgi:hypothetical protein